MAKVSSKLKARSNLTREVLAYRKLGGRPYLSRVHKLKANSAPDDLFKQFPIAVPHRSELVQVFGLPFPNSAAGLFSRHLLYEPARLLNELVWAIAYCGQYAEELRAFSIARKAFEKTLLTGNLASAADLLKEIEQKFGTSIWSIQNEIALAQLAGGGEARRVIAELEKQAGDGPGSFLTRGIITFTARRSDSGDVRKIASQIAELFEGERNPLIEAYLRAKLTASFNPAVSDIAPLLFIDANASVIDYYESLVVSLLSTSLDRNLSDAAAARLQLPLEVLYRRVKDPRLLPLIFSLGGTAVIEQVGISDRTEIIEAYSRGDLNYVADHCGAYLADNPDDMLVFTLSIRAACGIRRPPPDRKGILAGIASNLTDVFMLNEDAYSSALSVFALSDKFAGHSWASYLSAVVLNELREEAVGYPPQQLRRLVMLDSQLTPYIALCARGKAKSSVQSAESLNTSYPLTSAVIAAVLSGAPLPGVVERGRGLQLLARQALVRGDFEAAFRYYRELETSSDEATATRALVGQAIAAIGRGDIAGTAKAVIDGSIRNANVPTVFPVTILVEELEDPQRWSNTIDIPLVYDTYLSYFGSDKWPNLRFAFEKFQVENGIAAPADLVAQAQKWGLPRVIRYLSEVWKPEVMRQTILYADARQMEQARIEVCRALVEIDPSNASSYAEELKERVKHQEITRGASLVEQSKVYVDVPAIKRALRTKLSGSYGRYKNATQVESTRPKKIQLIYELASKVSDSLAAGESRISKFEVIVARTEADAQFDALFSEITSEFLNGDHGLNAYLSTRVRHGKLSNALRKPSADEHLITPKTEGGSSYVRNSYWLERLSAIGPQDLQAVSRALDEFSRQFDNVLDYINVELIRIKVASEVSRARGDADHEAFYYSHSGLERKFVRDYDKELTSLDDLIDRCVEILWEKTDANLISLQATLNKEIRIKLMACFDNLRESIEMIHNPELLGDLRNSIAKARTDTYQKLTHVMEWFKRSEVYDRQDYSLDFPVQVALNMLRRTNSAASEWEKVDIEIAPESAQMPGRTLDGMVDIVDVVLANAISHSGLAADELRVFGSMSLQEGKLTMRFENNLSPSAVTHQVREKLQKIRDDLDRADSRMKAQGEVESGLRKIWRTLKSPFYSSPTLTFDFGSNLDSFLVELSCQLEG